MALAALGLVLVIALPFYLDQFWLRLGFAICGAAIGAIGLNILTGATGQLSLAHAFFLALGAVSYSYFAGAPDPTRGPAGLGLPPAVAMVLAIALATLAGLAFSPVSSRLSGLYLGIASLSLVFLGQHLLATFPSITGGFEGRSTPDMSLLGFSFNQQPPVVVMGVPFGRFEFLWYFGFACLILCGWTVSNLLRAYPGRAMRLIRDREVSAGVVGVNVRQWKRYAFMLSSGLAGLSGVLFALLIGSIAPVSFTLEVSIQYLVMIVIGGMGSVSGAVVGATFVTSLPLLLQRYADVLPAIGSSVSPANMARYIYGVALVAVLALEPSGLVGGARRLAGHLRAKRIRRREPASGSVGKR